MDTQSVRTHLPAQTGQPARRGIVGVLVCALVLTGCQQAPPPPEAGASFTPAPTSGTPTRGASTPPPTGRTTVSPTSSSPPPNPGGLSDAELVGQLFVAYVYGASATTATPGQRQANLALYGAATGAEIVKRWHLGGIILIDHNNLDPDRAEFSTGNVDNPNQIAALTAGLQKAARADSGVPLLIGTDQEGGPVQRITNGVGWRPSERDEAGMSPAALSCSYRSLGSQLLALGVNQDYAPDADVVRTATGVIGDRSFGPDPAIDARDVQAAVAGLQSAGVLATLKHWPGHGSISTDSHLALAVIEETRAHWESIDRPPFQVAAANADSIMVGHLALPALDPSGAPATLSPILVNGALRHDLGYRGMVITDSLWMAPVQAVGSAGRVAELAIRAGDDLLLMSPDVPHAYAALLALVQRDKGFRSLVQASVSRVLAAKAKVAAGPHPLSGNC